MGGERREVMVGLMLMFDEKRGVKSRKLERCLGGGRVGLGERLLSGDSWSEEN